MEFSRAKSNKRRLSQNHNTHFKATSPADSNNNNNTNNNNNNNSNSNNNTTPWLGLAIVGGTIGGTLFLTAPFVLQYIRSPLPYMATPKAKVQRALQFVSARQRHYQNYQKALQQQQKQLPLHTANQMPPHNNIIIAKDNDSLHFVDLGSGDGEAVYQALLTRHYATATGMELNFTLWALSQVRRNLLWTREQRRQSSFLCQDLFSYDLKRADTVMIFGVPPLMESISHKLAQECRPGTHVLAYRFPIPLQNTATTNDTNVMQHKNDHHIATGTQTEVSNNGKKLLNARLVYDEEEMRIYECTKSTN